MSDPDAAAFSALRNGALRRSDIQAAIANHSLAKSDIYGELVDALIRDVTAPSEIPTTQGHQALRLLFAVASNPLAPLSILESLVSGLAYQIEASAPFFNAGEKQQTPILSSTARGAMSKICHAILYHPNWDGRDHHPLALASGLSASRTGRGPGFGLPTASDRTCDTSTSNDQEGLLRLYAFQSPKDEFVKQYTRDIIAECADGAPTEGQFRFSDRYYQIGYGAGYYLRLMKETREAFGEVGEAIPAGWIAELTF